MTSGTDAPVFGTRVPGVTYVRRPSAYAIIRRGSGSGKRGEVAVVRTRHGIFLPGGGVEPGESDEQAARRETLEECGFAIRVIGRLPGAVQLVYSPGKAKYFEKICVFFEAVVLDPAAPARPHEHDVDWLAPDVAASTMTHESHQWALRVGVR